MIKSLAETSKYCKPECYRAAKPSKKIKYICQHCGKICYATKGRGSKYCSNTCKGMGRRKRIKKTCPVCGERFYIRMSHINKKKCCSTSCSRKHNIGEKHPNYKGGQKASKKRSYNKLKHDLKYRLNARIRNGIHGCLKISVKAGRRWEDLVGYSWEQLKIRLQYTMPKGYTWDDFMTGKLHVDHIRPINSFDFSVPEDLQFQQCWALSNLQLLPASENIRKGAKYPYSYQTSLSM